MKLEDEDYGYKLNPEFKPGGLLVDSLQTVVFALCVCVVVYLFLAIPNQVQGRSMDPTLATGDILLTNKFIQISGGESGMFKNYNYKRGDIVVFQQPGEDDLVKRIIGMPGDTIKLREGRVIVNEQVLIEDYLPAGRRTIASDFIPENVEKRVPEDSYFVLGDNRSNSRDSRVSGVGFIRREDIKGSPFVRLAPLDSFRFLGSGEIETIPETEVFGS